MPLTDTAIRKAKSADKPQRLFDGGGMYLEISRSEEHTSELQSPC